MRILLIEDDEGMIDVVRQALRSQHYLVDVATDGQAGWELAGAFAYDLILLDLMLPRLDGLLFCQQLRGRDNSSAESPNRHTPTLLITAQAASTDKVMALDAGADDYLVKPFDLNELLARVRALLRRSGNWRSPLLTWGSVQLNPSTCEVTIAGQPIHLSAKEYRLLEVLLRAPKRIFSYSALIEHLWAEDIPTENAVRAQIKGLRKKLKEAGSADIIETIYGLGYRLREIPGSREPEAQPGEEIPGSPVPVDPLPQDLQTAARALFARHRAGYCERLTVLEHAVDALQHQELSEELRQHAYQEAHTLKGSLGLFEMDRASQLAWEIERLLQHPSLKEHQQILAYRVIQLKQCLESEQPAVVDVAVDRARNAQPECPTATIWIIGNDQPLVDQFVRVASTYSVQIETMTPTEERGYCRSQSPPDAILLLLDPSPKPEDWVRLQDLSTHHSTIPLFVVAPSMKRQPLEDWQLRLKVAQWGAKGFWQGAIEPDVVLQTLVQSISVEMETTARILVVDDDPAMLETVQTILHPWGFELTGLNNPQEFWETLEKTQPELVILDIEMPGVSGIELCQVIRQDGQWGELPVLFLSAHNDDATLQKIFLVGADDYISKPVRAVELVSRVLRRLEQARLLKRLHQLRP